MRVVVQNTQQRASFGWVPVRHLHRCRPPPLPKHRCQPTPRQTAAASSASAHDLASTSHQTQKQQDLVQEALQQVALQQAADGGETYPLHNTREVVESAMLAAVTGLVYTLGNLLKLESYLAYLLPLPVVLSALRSGPVPALKTLTVTCLLLLILMGPVRATTYLLVYGVLSLALAVCWALRLPWGLSIPLAALARIGGYMAYIALSSWVTNENLLMLMLSNVYALLDQLSAWLGTTGSPPLLAVAIVLCSLLFVNSLMYVALSHVLYAVILRGMGLKLYGAPKFVERFVSGIPT